MRFVSMIYRKATVADIPHFVESRRILLKREDDRSIDGILEEYFTDAINGAMIAWVAEEKNQVVSTVYLCICPLVPRFDNLSGKVAYLTNMYTVPGYRRQGVASCLLHEAIKDAQAQGIKKVLLNSTDMAISIYEKLGFTKCESYYEFIVS
jgi:ribosomal protein S18 acetylase RimI-like enzyme